MRRYLTVLLAGALLSVMAFSVRAKSKEEERLENSGEVMKEILNVPDDIPQDLLDKAECVIVYPSVKKGAFIVGASYGRGAMTCRTGQHYTGPWGPPTMMALEGGSFGLQLGGEATDFVLLVMNPKGANSILSSKVKLGADASAAGGPKGRTAEASTDVAMNAEILTYSRAKGLFAGISLAGSTIRPDGDANKVIYGKEIDPKDIVHGGVVGVPPTARDLIGELQKHSPKNLSDPKSLQ